MLDACTIFYECVCNDFFTNENGDKNTNDKHFLILNESV